MIILWYKNERSFFFLYAGRASGKGDLSEASKYRKKTGGGLTRNSQLMRANITPGPYDATQVTTRYNTPQGLGNHQGRHTGRMAAFRQPNINGLLAVDGAPTTINMEDHSII